MRFHIMHKKINQPKEEYRVFFETDSIDEAKYFAMRADLVDVGAGGGLIVGDDGQHLL